MTNTDTLVGPRVIFTHRPCDETKAIETHVVMIPVEIMGIENTYNRRHIAIMYALGVFSGLTVTYRHDAYTMYSYDIIGGK